MVRGQQFIDFTFHSGYIPINPSDKRKVRSIPLYIPFWIYSNAVSAFKEIRDLLFTFHSGYIPIPIMCLQIRAIMNFTFHSGYIPIYHQLLYLTYLKAFTFHSGYIPMKSSLFCEKIS